MIPSARPHPLTTRPRRAGAPLVVLATVILLWVGVRAAEWQPMPLDSPADPLPSHPPRRPHTASPPLSPPLSPSPIIAPPLPQEPSPAAQPPATLWHHARVQPPLRSPATSAVASFAMATDDAPWVVPHPTPPSTTRTPRWSADGWLLMRRGGDRAAASAGGAHGTTYGANQLGAVLRYRLAPGDPRKPTLYLRGYAALNGTGESEAALGFSARPMARLPVAAMLELRASHFADGTLHTRPAATLVSELPPLILGEGIEAEAYAQAGYVGGAAATPFIDGQMRFEETALKLGAAEVRLGAGAWGGAQQGAGRLDLGPTLRVVWAKGPVGARLAVDWRLRVAGNAQPSSGPALTLSAGF